MAMMIAMSGKTKKLKIVWPVRDKKDFEKTIKDGTINGVPFKQISEECNKEAEVYFKTNFCDKCGSKKPVETE